LIVPPNDPRAIATAVQRLESDAALRARLIEGGLRTARILTVDRLADAFEEWHLTAAQHFANGVPADRPSPLAEAGLTAPAGSPR
jgi:hypothetical protein